MLAAAAMAAAAGTAAAQQPAPAGYKIGYVSTARVLRDSRVSRQTSKALEDEIKKRDAEILAGPKDEVERRRAAMSEDMAQKREQALKEFIGKSNRAIQRVAAAERFDIVLFEAAYANPRIDITDKVIKALDAER